MKHPDTPISDNGDDLPFYHSTDFPSLPPSQAARLSFVPTSPSSCSSVMEPQDVVSSPNLRISHDTITSPNVNTAIITRNSSAERLTTPSTSTAAESSESLDLRSSALTIVDGSHDIHPILAVGRFDRNITLLYSEAENHEQCIIKARTTSFARAPIYSEWSACTHPQGALYFYHSEKRIYTDANLYDPNILIEIQAFICLVDKMVQETRAEPTAAPNSVDEANITKSEKMDLVLELNDSDDGGHKWCYYFVNHTDRALFWLHDFDISEHVKEVLGRKSPPHIKYEIEKYYWRHLRMFPHRCVLSKDVFIELTSTILYASVDKIDPPDQSTITYSGDQLRDMLRLVKEARILGYNAYTTYILAQLMEYFAHLKFLNFHGQYGARLTKNQNVYRAFWDSSKAPFRGFLEPLFFGTKLKYLRDLQDVWADGIFHGARRDEVNEKMRSTWQQITTVATLIVSRNVQFLSSGAANAGGILATISRYASMTSLVLVYGSFLSALINAYLCHIEPGEFANGMAYPPVLIIRLLAIQSAVPAALLVSGDLYAIHTLRQLLGGVFGDVVVLAA
ncbi:hypothetical protein B0H21DRAFT_388772 [Amylocystis lapponica]|nr:hypothetical protein B0H21DRAFT_388772 [Amylocystis lapponica]